MKRKYQRLGEVLGYGLAPTDLKKHTIESIAGRQARVLWPNDTPASKRLIERFISDVVWYSGRNDHLYIDTPEKPDTITP